MPTPSPRLVLSRTAAVIAAAVLAVGLSACTSPASTTPAPGASETTVIAPVVEEANGLDGTTIQLVVGQVLDIDVGDLPVDSYTGTIADPEVAEFVQGRDDGSATFNPGVTALAEGSTQVTLASQQGGIEEVRFTVDVTAP